MTRPPTKIAASSDTIGVYDLWAPRLIVGLAWTLPFILSLSMDDAFDLPKLSLMYAVVIVLAGLWAWQAWTQRAMRWRRSVLDLPLLVFFIVAAAAAFFSIDRPVSWVGTYKIYVFGWLPMAAAALLYLFTLQVASDRLIERLQTAFIGAGIGVTLYALMQYTGNEIFERMPAAVGGRVWSSLGNPIYLGAVCMMAAAIALPVLIRKSDRIASALAPGALFLLLGSGVVISLSRSAWVGTLVAVALIVTVLWQSLKQRPALVVFLFAAIAVVGMLPGPRARVRVMISASESSNAARIAGWKAGLRVWRDHPLLGTGPDTFFQSFRRYRSLEYVRAAGPSVTQADAHNDFIQFAATQGAAGLLAFAWILVAGLQESRRRWRMDPRWIGFAAALAALEVQNQFNFSSITTLAWAAIIAGVMLGRPQAGANEPRRELSAGLRSFVLLILALCPVAAWAVSIPLRAEQAYKAGQSWVLQNRPLKALPEYRRATQLLPREIYLTELTNLYRTLGRLSSDGPERENYFDRAWETAERQVRDHPANPDAWNNRGVAAMWLVQLAKRPMQPEARRSFETATTLDPVFVDAWANLARWEHLAGHLEEERELWMKVLEIDPAHPMALRVLAAIR